MKAIETSPTVKVTVKKSALKVYNVQDVNTVYLKDGSEFEIELFNPTQDIILTKIKINGKTLNGGGLVLNPGQRIFLERYLDIAKKFKFETYEVDDTPEVRYAINNNGLVEVEFFRETPKTITWNNDLQSASRGVWAHPSNVVLGGPSSRPNWDNFYTTCNTVNLANSTNSVTLNANSVLCSTSTPTINFCCTPDAVTSPSYTLTASSNIFETGRVEQGSSSNQKFIDVNKTFQLMPFQVSKVKIVPDSQKIYTAEDIKHRSYCSECGKKVKQNDKFCSSCGTKL